MPELKGLLHVGCGGSALPEYFSSYRELRFDMDPSSGADLIGDMLAIDLPDGAVDAIYTCHTLEHVTYHDGIRALREFLRVLRPGGLAWVVVPNVGACADAVRDGDLLRVMYQSPAGPVTAADMIYGHQGLIERDRQDRAYRFQHRFGYTRETLAEALRDAGFDHVGVRVSESFDLVALGQRPTERSL